MTPAAELDPSADADALKRKGWLLAGYQATLGHELPNHLLGIQGLAQLVLADEAQRLTPGGRDLLQRLAHLAARTHRMVRAVAEIGRLDRDPGPPEPVPLTQIVTEAVAVVKFLCDRPAVDYIIEQSMPTVVVARRALCAALQQLLQNATRAVRANPAARIEISARPTPAGLELRVTDNGCGLSADRQVTAFEAFHADDASEGPGLGLFLVRQVVAGWNGSVHVNSEPGKGATFTIRIP